MVNNNHSEHQNSQDEFKPFTVENEYVFTPQCPLPGTALTCLNGLKHGATSRLLFIPGEQPQAFYNLLAESFKTHQPGTTEDAAIVTDSVLARWYLWRRQRAQYKREFEVFTASGPEDSPTAAGVKELELFDRYCTSAERKLNRALTSLQRIKKSALDIEKWQAQHALQKQRFEFDRERFEFRKEQDARVAPKIKAEAKLAADSTQKTINEQNEKKDRDRVEHPIIFENGEWIIRQLSVVTQSERGLTWASYPLNRTVQNLIANRDASVVPPVKVLRDFHFKSGGLIPAAYAWVFEGVNRAAIALPPDTDGIPGLRCPLTFDQWLKLAEQERRQTHVHPSGREPVTERAA